MSLRLILDEMPNSEEKKCVEERRHQVACHSRVKKSDLVLFLSKKLPGKNGEEIKEREIQ